MNRRVTRPIIFIFVNGSFVKYSRIVKHVYCKKENNIHKTEMTRKTRNEINFENNLSFE